MTPQLIHPHQIDQEYFSNTHLVQPTDNYFIDQTVHKQKARGQRPRALDHSVSSASAQPPPALMIGLPKFIFV